MAPASDSVGRFRELIYVFLKLGALSYGGPAIMGIMQAELQEKRQWLSKEKFLEGLGLVNMLPGPAATQLGIYIGYDRAGWRGGVLAGLCFMLPAFLILTTLTAAYSAFGSVQLAQDAFYGIGPVVLGIFVVAVWRLGRAGLKTKTQVLVAVASAIAVAVAPLGIASVSCLLVAPALLSIIHVAVALWPARS